MIKEFQDSIMVRSVMKGQINDISKPKATQVMVTSGKFETLIDLTKPVTEITPIGKLLGEETKEAMSELYIELLFPLKVEHEENLTLSLVNGGFKSIFNLPIFFLYDKIGKPVHEIVHEIMNKKEVVIKRIGEIFGPKSDDHSLILHSYYLPPMNYPFCLPFIYETKEDDPFIIQQKKDFHLAFLLEEEPILKFYLSIEEKPQLDELFAGKIRSIHKYCLGKRYLNENSIIETVRGNYYYYHYLQDKETDSGWGCAYRSLQTLISWFIAQGYANIKMPTIIEIQKALVDMKDKPSTFVGTNEWIGAYEVMLCLNYFLKIESNIMNLNSGGDIIRNYAPIAIHFRKHGTPIMIGGGSYAYTIIGIEYDETTGDVMLLILDPHYTGSDSSYQYIIQKGWCKWKKCDMFRVDTFYNLCLPPAPKLI